MSEPISVDGKGFLVVDGVKTSCKLVRGQLQFCIKDKRVASARRSRFIEVKPEEIARVDKNVATS